MLSDRVQNKNLHISYYASYGLRIFWGVVCLICLIIIYLPISAQIGSKFSLQLFFIAFFLMNLFAPFFYFFLKFLLAPILHIYGDEIIVSKYKRIHIPIPSVNCLEMVGRNINIKFLNGNRSSHIKLKVLAARKSVEIENGKFTKLIN